jgi:nitronate monooxygenase
MPIVEASGEDTERSGVLDIARGSAWPREYTARTLGHPFLDRWRGREHELAADPEARQAYRDGIARGDLPPLPVWAGEATGLINDLPPASGLVAALAAQAEEALERAGRR